MCVIRNPGAEWGLGPTPMEQYVNTCPMDNFFTSAAVYIEKNPYFLLAFENEKEHDQRAKEVIEFFCAGNYGMGHKLWMETLRDYEMNEWQRKNREYQNLPANEKNEKIKKTLTEWHLLDNANRKDMYGNIEDLVYNIIDNGDGFLYKRTCTTSDCLINMTGEEKMPSFFITPNENLETAMANITCESPGDPCSTCKTGVQKRSAIFVGAHKPPILHVAATVTVEIEKFYRDLPYTLNVGGQTYKLAGATLKKFAGDHFFAVLEVEDRGNVTYDGLIKKDKRFRITNPSDFAEGEVQLCGVDYFIQSVYSIN